MGTKSIAVEWSFLLNTGGHLRRFNCTTSIFTTKHDITFTPSPRHMFPLYIPYACRPGSEDVMVLKKELITVQTLMDNMSLAQEKEKEDLQKEYDTLKQQAAQYVVG